MSQLPTLSAPAPSGVGAPKSSVPELIGQVYESAPPNLRARMLEHLIRPLGILSLIAVADGVFASIRLRNPSVSPKVLIEDTSNIEPSDVVKLADWVQQVSVEAFGSLANLISTSSVLTRSTVAAVLLTLLVQHTRRRDDRRRPGVEA